MKDKPDTDTELKAALYALGTLTQMEARAYEEDAATCGEDLRASLDDFADVVELLSYAAEEAAPPAAVRDRLNELLTAEPRAYNPYAPPAKAATAPPQDLPELLTVRRDEGRWFQLHQGVFVKSVFTDPRKGSTSYLVRFEPGAKSPLHRHPQVEECVVIEGDFHVDGKALGPGDYHCAMAGSTHDRPYTVGGALVMIIASEPYEQLEN